MWEALKFGHAEIQRLCEFEQEIVKECGKEKYVPTLFQVDPEIEAAVKAYAEENMIKAIRVEDKLERYAAIDKVNQDTLEEFGKKVFVKDLGDIKVEDTEAKECTIYT